MNRKSLHSFLIILALLAWSSPGMAHILDLSNRQYTSFSDVLDDLEQVRVIFVGELHDQSTHHAAQLQVIRALVERGQKVAVALEMFRAEGQPDLDRWSNGLLDEEEFKLIYEDHWSMWPIYKPIFNYARQFRLPLVGLNIDRDITRRIAAGGFDSLSAEQLTQLDGISCDVDQRYQDHMRKALGQHASGMGSFRYFCEAQLVWDTMMARHLLNWQERHPDTIIVVLAGSTHAWRYGIPEQLKRRSDLTYRILLPEIPGRSDPSNTSSAEADYLLLGVDQGALH